MSQPPPLPPFTFAIGVGLRTRATAGALRTLWQQAHTLLRSRLPVAMPDTARPADTPAPLRPACIAALPHQLNHPALQQWMAIDWANDGSHAPHKANAAATPVALLPVPLHALPAQPTRSQSPQAQARYGCGSVAEACALWAAAQMCAASSATLRHTPRLLLPRLIATDGCATLAVACAG